MPANTRTARNLREGAVVAGTNGFQFTTIVPAGTVGDQPPAPAPVPPMEEEPQEDGEKQDSGAEETLWRALSLARLRGEPVAVRPNRKHRRRAALKALDEDEDGTILV
jgi:hypothetical protein